jgi:hypothetical protein
MRKTEAQRKKFANLRIIARRNRNKKKYLNNGNNLVAIHDENDDGYIVLKQDSLYKPLLIVFGIQLLIMMIIFPNIFDEL